MSYGIRYSSHIDWKRLHMLPVKDRKRIRTAIEQKIAVDPARFGRPLRKSLYGCRSLRIGEYRIIYCIEKESVDILLFGHRSTVYSDAEKVL